MYVQYLARACSSVLAAIGEMQQHWRAQEAKGAESRSLFIRHVIRHFARHFARSALRRQEPAAPAPTRVRPSRRALESALAGRASGPPSGARGSSHTFRL